MVVPEQFLWVERRLHPTRGSQLSRVPHTALVPSGHQHLAAPHRCLLPRLPVEALCGGAASQSPRTLSLGWGACSEPILPWQAWPREGRWGRVEVAPEAGGSCRRAVAAASGFLGDDTGLKEAGRLCGRPGAQGSLGAERGQESWARNLLPAHRNQPAPDLPLLPPGGRVPPEALGAAHTRDSQ